jgi:hypothetical protein
MAPTGVLELDLVPRIGTDLLVAEAHALRVGIELQDLDLELRADLEHLARVVDAPVGHVRDVEQPVDAAEIDERTVVGDVLHDALHDGADREVLERLEALDLAVLLEEHAPAEHDVAAALVELDDLEVHRLADELLEVLHRTQIDLRARKNALTPMSTDSPPFTRDWIVPRTTSSASTAFEISSQAFI